MLDHFEMLKPTPAEERMIREYIQENPKAWRRMVILETDGHSIDRCFDRSFGRHFDRSCRVALKQHTR